MKTVAITVGGVPLIAELADTPVLKARGLSGRAGLPDGHCMVFPYGGCTVRAFWMPAVPFPVDLLACVAGKVAAVHSLRPLDETPVHARGDTFIELPGGWAAANGIAPGAEVDA